VYAQLQATRNGIRVSDLRDYEAFADKLRKLALDGAKRFEGFDYDVEADLEAYLKIIPRVLPLITDTVPSAGYLISYAALLDLRFYKHSLGASCCCNAYRRRVRILMAPGFQQAL